MLPKGNYLPSVGHPCRHLCCQSCIEAMTNYLCGSGERNEVYEKIKLSATHHPHILLLYSDFRSSSDLPKIDWISTSITKSP